MNIIIAGYGFVGKVHALALESQHSVSIHDPQQGYTADFNCADAVIIAVSTPQNIDGSCNTDNVADILAKAPLVPVLIKSTISIEGWKNLNKIFSNLQITFSPEYLRAESALHDFKNQQLVSIGGGAESFWAQLLAESLGVKVEISNPEQLILTKYTRNSFLALKVSFFNQIFDLCKQLDVDYEEVRKGVIQDDRIGASHTIVTNERGFGGHCFPKDTSALVSTARSNRTSLSLLEEAIAYNDKLHKSNK